MLLVKFKSAFNEVVKYFSYNDLEKRIIRRRKFNSVNMMIPLLKDYKLAIERNSIKSDELWENFKKDLDLIFLEVDNPEPNKLVSIIHDLAPNAEQSANNFISNCIKKNQTIFTNKAYQEFKVNLWNAIKSN